MFSKCSDNFFDCNNGRCIARFFECDDDNDCGNFADELHCVVDDDLSNGNDTTKASTTATGSIIAACPADHFACNDQLHTCIPSRWVCDGMKECANGADENNCTMEKMKHTCGDDFVCHSLTQCIPPMWRCDGVLDCDDGSDEHNCTKIKESASVVCDKEHGKFQCGDGKCIDYAQVCNNITECSAGEDEGLHCHMRACQDKKCSHICMLDPKTNGSQCFCPPGFKLLNGQTCMDFDECSDNQILNVCSQKCTNLEGSFKCTCFDNYELVKDETNTTEVCRVKGDNPLLYYSNGDVVGVYDLRKKTSTVLDQAHLGETIIGMDVKVNSRKLFYLSSDLKTVGSVNVAEIDGHLSSRALYHESIKSIEGIAVDWLNDHYYLSESEKHSIIVCNIGAQLCTTLLAGLRNPRGLLVLPATAKLYWTEWGEDGAIFEAGMDGTNKVVLVPNLKWPNDLAYDEVRNRLYWCDGKDGIIEYYDFGTKLRHIVLQDAVRQPFSLAVFEDRVYWSDWASDTLESCDKITGHHIERIGTYNRRIFGISIFHPTLQGSTTMKPYNPCEINTCSHICLLQNTASYSCHCPDHMVLGKDNRTCVQRDGQAFALVTTGSQLFKYYLDDINTKHTEEVPMLRHFKIGAMAFNYAQQDLYIFDRLKRHIGVLHLGRTFTRRWSLLVSDQVDEVLDMKYDVNTDSIYWVDYFKKTLEVATVDGKYRAIVAANLSKPVSLAIDGALGVVYVGDRGAGSTPSTIKRMYLDGSGSRVVMSSHAGVPMSLAINKAANQLVWADPALQKIEFFSLDSHKVVHKIQKSVNNVNSIALLGGYIFWTDLDSNRMFYTKVNGTDKVIHNRVIESGKFDDNFNIKVIEAEKQSIVNTACKVGNNHCQHICLPSGNGAATCKCTLGFSLMSDGKSCHEESVIAPISPFHVSDFEDPFADLNIDDVLSQVDDWDFPLSIVPAPPAITTTTPPPKPTTTTAAAPIAKNNSMPTNDANTNQLTKEATGVTFGVVCLRLLFLASVLGIAYALYRL